MDRREKWLAVACTAARFAVCCYRAAHQAIVIDEATTFNKFVSGPWRKLFGRFDANNHILSSLLIKLTVTLAGVSEFTLRFPSLVAGFFLTLGVFWLLKRVDSPVLRWTAFAMFCLHPMMLDFSIAARGYSLSLAFFAWALYFAWERKYWPAGFLLGLSIAANLTILFPAVALLVAVAIFERRAKPVFVLLLPALLLGGGINGPSLRRAHRDDFYIGYPELHTAVTSFVFTSLHAIPDHDGILGNRDAADRIGTIAVPLFGLLLAAAAWFEKDRRKLIPLLVLAIACLGLLLARWIFGINYPADRTCLYFVILAAVAWAVAGDVVKNRVLFALWILPAALLIVQFSTQLQMRYFQFWRVETDDKMIARMIQQASEGKPVHSLAISASWIHQPTLEFYRRVWHIDALKPVERLEPTPLTGFDFYVLSWGDVDRAQGTKLCTVFADTDTQVVLAEP